MLLRRLCVFIALLATAIPATAGSGPLVLDRVAMLLRHGVRAPLDGEAPAEAATAAPWPRWPVAQSLLTPHGAESVRLIARYQRAMLVARGLLPPDGCPAPDAVRIWTNTAPRTIATGQAYAEGLAPGCALPVGHLDGERTDPLFEPLNLPGTPFDGPAILASIAHTTGGIDRLTDRHRAGIAELERVLDCAGVHRCGIAALPAGVAVGRDGRGIDLTGPIRVASGTAQVLLLQYAEGLPRAQVGWGRADAATIRRLGALHAALFDVFTRPPAMAAIQSAYFGRRMLDTLTAPQAPALDLLVGHDTNVTALAAILGVHLDAPGFARDDVAPGGAILLERWRDARGQALVRAVYQAPALDDIRALTPLTVARPPHRQILRIPACGRRAYCPLDRFAAIVTARLGPLP